MKKILYILCCTISVQLFGCINTPIAKMTDKYIEVVRPGQILGLVEIDALKIDSTFGYPIKEREIVAYTIVDRKNHKRVSPNASIKMYFGDKNDKYCWEVSPDLFSAKVYHTDTLHIKPYTWYRLSTEKYKFSVYFYLDESKGVYKSILKPYPGAY
jgi:hypothetical protein